MIGKGIEGDRKRKWGGKGKGGCERRKRKRKEKVYLMLLQSKEIICNLSNHLFSYMGLLEFYNFFFQCHSFLVINSMLHKKSKKQKIKFKFNFLSI